MSLMEKTAVLHMPEWTVQAYQSLFKQVFSDDFMFETPKMYDAL